MFAALRQSAQSALSAVGRLGPVRASTRGDSAAARRLYRTILRSCGVVLCEGRGGQGSAGRPGRECHLRPSLHSNSHTTKARRAEALPVDRLSFNSPDRTGNNAARARRTILETRLLPHSDMGREADVPRLRFDQRGPRLQPGRTVAVQGPAERRNHSQSGLERNAAAVPPLLERVALYRPALYRRVVHLKGDRAGRDRSRLFKVTLQISHCLHRLSAGAPRLRPFRPSIQTDNSGNETQRCVRQTHAAICEVMG